jgi:hypothetical protein
VVAEGKRAGLHHHVVEGRDHLPLLRLSLELCPSLDGGAHVDLGLQIEMRSGRLRLGHPPGDRLLQASELDDLYLALGGLGLLGHAGSRCGGGHGPPRGRLGGDRRRFRLGRGGHAGGQRPLDVGLDDPATRSRAAQPV